MYGKFLIKSRHGTTYYFRRRVPDFARAAIGRAILIRSLQTTNPRLAMIRGRALSAHTDALFLRIAMAKKNGNAGEIRVDYNISFDFGKDGILKSRLATQNIRYRCESADKLVLAVWAKISWPLARRGNIKSIFLAALRRL